MTDAERTEARAIEPGIARELGQSFYLIALLALPVVFVLGLGLLAGRLLG